MSNDTRVIRPDKRDPVASVRVSPDLGRRLAVVAGGRSRSDVMRDALIEYIERRESEAHRG